MSSITCLNVRDKNGDVVNIAQLTRENRNERGVLTCFGCDRAMVPVLGAKKEHHFRHKADSEATCSFETYLHRMTKNRVYNLIKARLEKKLDLRILRRNAKWKRFEKLNGDVILSDYSDVSHQLLDGADTIHLERGFSGFVPDVCIERPGRLPVFIEIAVTHACEPEKIASGIPIVEFHVTSEAESDELVSSLGTGMILTCDEVPAYNFPDIVTVERQPAPVVVKKAPFKRQSLVHQRPAVLLKSTLAFAFSRNAKPKSYGASAKRQHNLEPTISMSDIQLTDAYVQHLKFDLGEKVKSCLLCVRHLPGYGAKDVYCTYRSMPVNQGDAVGCRSFFHPAERKELISIRRKSSAASAMKNPFKTLIPPAEVWPVHFRNL